MKPLHTARKICGGRRKNYNNQNKVNRVFYGKMERLNNDINQNKIDRSFHRQAERLIIRTNEQNRSFKRKVERP